MEDILIPVPTELGPQAIEPCIVELPLKISPNLRLRLDKVKQDGRTRQVNAYLRRLIEAGITAMEKQVLAGRSASQVDN